MNWRGPEQTITRSHASTIVSLWKTFSAPEAFFKDPVGKEGTGNKGGNGGEWWWMAVDGGY